MNHLMRCRMSQNEELFREIQRDVAEQHRDEAEERRKVGLWYRLSHPSEYRYANRLANVFLFLGCVLIIGQLWILQASVKKSRESDDSPVTFRSKARPAAKVFYRGEWAKFEIVYDCKEDNLTLLVVDSFQDVKSGYVYPGTMLIRNFRKAGPNKVEGVRKVPGDLSPGTYRIVGTVTAQTSVRTLPTSYESEPFEVK